MNQTEQQEMSPHFQAALERIKAAHGTLESKTYAEMCRKEDEESAARIERQRIEEAFKNAKVPERHNQFKSGDCAEWNQKLEWLKSKLSTGITIGLIGERGTGKTQMAVELIRHNSREMRSSRFITAMEFFIEIKGTFRKDSNESEQDVIDKFRKVKLLVIDEIGKRGESDWENNLLFELLNKRYGDMTDTVLIDNRSKLEFTNAIGASLASRIHETGGLIECKWESFRK